MNLVGLDMRAAKILLFTPYAHKVSVRAEFANFYSVCNIISADIHQAKQTTSFVNLAVGLYARLDVTRSPGACFVDE